MAVEVQLNTPLAEALSGAVQPKLVEVGWTGEDDTSLAEYIILMLVNGKTQEQIASELAQDLLPDGEGTVEFAQWLFEQVLQLQGGGGQTAAVDTQTPTSAQPQVDSIPSNNVAPTDMTMSEAASTPVEANVYVFKSEAVRHELILDRPTGPKAMRGGRQSGRGGRTAGNMNKHMDKSGDSVLHRTRGQTGINSHRGAPRGPRNDQNRMMRPQAQQQLGAALGMGGPPNMQNDPNMMMSAQQQMQFMAMMEEQARMMAQFMPGMMTGGMGQGFQGNNQPGRSLSDRIEAPSRGRGRGGRGGKKPYQNGHAKQDEDTTMGDDGSKAEGDPSSSMEVESSQQNSDPANTLCRFNLKCTRKDCTYAHQTPAAPEGITVDMSDTCSFGAACKNHRCTGKHPSPAQKFAHQAEEQCKFWPNCSNPTCPFKHPTMPICRNGADCDVQGCKFSHLQTPCRFNPCLNARCPYKHAEGQKQVKGHVWTADGTGQNENGHVSERKFVEDGAEEELIKPDANEAAEGVVT